MIKEPPQIQYLNKLGEGAYGCVYKAKNIKTGDIVAVKKIMFDHQDQGISSTTLRELAILKKLNHPNIIRMFDYSINGNHMDPNIELIFQFMDEDLTKNMKRVKKYETNAVKDIMRQIIQGLKYIHSQTIMHRDLKPQNILINSKGDVKIADFGLGRIVGKRLITMSKEIETLWYRSPELLFGTLRYDYSVDIWSLGCIFYELAEHRILFQGESQLGQIMEIMKFCGTPHIAQWESIIHMPLFKPNFPKFDPMNRSYKNLCQNGIDLLENMIRINPLERISIKDAINHPYFRNE